MKDDIIATVVGDLCHAEGFTVRHNAPVLAMCRLLVDLGYDPRRPLLAFRGTELAMAIKSIGYGAGAPQEMRWPPPRYQTASRRIKRMGEIGADRREAS